MIILKNNDNKKEAILENFKNVLESAYESYGEDLNESHDFVGICLNNLDNNDMEFINESIESQILFDSLNESEISEAINVTDAKVVQEKRGKGISVKINGKEYRYVSPTRSTEDLFKSFNGMLEHGIAGWKALNYLKNNALCYYGSKNDSEEGQKIVGVQDNN